MDIKTKPVAVMCFSSGTGGMERSAVRLADTLSRVSEVVLLCKHGSFIEKLYQQGNYPFKCEPIRFSSRLFSPAMLFGVRATIDTHDIHNVIFFGASELKTLYFSFMGKALNVTVWHGTTKSRAKRDALHNLVYSCVDHHVAISQHLDRNVREIVPTGGKADYQVIRPSFEFDIDSDGVARKQNRKNLNIVHVGRVVQGKGQIDAVLACAGLYEAGVKFELKLVGGGEGDGYMEELEKTIESSNYKKSVHLEGYVKEVDVYLNEADIFLFPSAGEGMPGSVIESLNYPLICVTYDNTVFPEFSEMGFHFHTVNDGDVDELKLRLLLIANDLDSEKKRASKNPGIAKRVFGRDLEIAEWHKILV